MRVRVNIGCHERRVCLAREGGAGFRFLFDLKPYLLNFGEFSELSNSFELIVCGIGIVER